MINKYKKCDGVCNNKIHKSCINHINKKDFTNTLKEAVDFPVIAPTNGPEVLKAFKAASNSGKPAIIIERKSFY